MEQRVALETAKAIDQAGMTVTADLVAELQGVTPEEAHGALEALVLAGRLYTLRMNAAGIAAGQQDYGLAAYVPLVA